MLLYSCITHLVILNHITKPNNNINDIFLFATNFKIEIHDRKRNYFTYNYLYPFKNTNIESFVQNSYWSNLRDTNPPPQFLSNHHQSRNINYQPNLKSNVKHRVKTMYPSSFTHVLAIPPPSSRSDNSRVKPPWTIVQIILEITSIPWINPRREKRRDIVDCAMNGMPRGPAR